MELKESINIPIGTSFDNKGIVSAEQAFSKFGKDVNNTLKRLGSDKSMGQLGASVKATFDAGLKGSENLMEKMIKVRSGAIDAAVKMDKLTAAIEKQHKATDEAYANVSNVDREESRMVMKQLMTSGEKEVYDKYLITKQTSEQANNEYQNYKLQNNALMEGLEFKKQYLAYYKMENVLAERMTKHEEESSKLTQAHLQQQADFWNSNGLKGYQDMFKKHRAYDSNGEKTQLFKDYDALRARQREERDAFNQSLPKTSEKLENMRTEFRRFIEEYRSELEKFDQSFNNKNLVGQVKTIQSYIQKMGLGRLETDMNGIQRLTSDTVKEEERLRQKAEGLDTEYKNQRRELEEIFVGHADETEEVKEQKKIQEQLTEEYKNQEAVLEVNAKRMMNIGQASQEALDSHNSEVSDGEGYENALKKVFSWQRVFTIVGKLVQQVGNNMQDLSRKIWSLLINIGKLGVAMMKTFGTGIIRGISTVGKTISNIRKRFTDMLPSMKQVARFLVKYIFGFRTMYFLVRKVRQAIKEGFKSMAKVDESVNKSISSLVMALNQLKGQVGASFAPLLNAVAPVLVNIINLATKATVQIGAFLATLMGQHTFKVAIADNVDYAESLDKTAGAAGKAAKAIKAYLSPLDELNRMDDPNSGSGGGGSGAGVGDDLAVRYKDIDVNSLGISKFAQELKKAWLDQDWEGVGNVISDKLEEVFDTISAALSWKNVEQKIGKFTDIVAGIVNGISENEDMWESLGSAIGNGFNTAIKGFNQLIGKVRWKDIGTGIATAIGEAIEKIDPKDISKFLEDKFTVVLDLLIGFMEKMKKDGSWTKIAIIIIQSLNRVNWYDIALKTFTFAGNLFKAIIDVLKGFITQGGFNRFVTELTNGINDSIAKLTPDDFKKAGETLSSALIIVLQNIGKFLNGSSESGKKILEGIKTFLLSIDWETALTEGADIATALANGLIAIFATVGEIMNKKDESGQSLAIKFGQAVAKAINGIDFTQLGQGFGNFAEGILDGIIAAFWNTTTLGKIWDFIVGIFSTDSPIVQGLMQAAPWLAFVGAIVTGIGKAIPLVLSANQATGGKLASMIGSWFTSGGAAGGATGGAAGGSAGGISLAGLGQAAVVLEAIAAAAVMVGLAIDDVKEKWDAWTWGIEEIGKADSPVLKTFETIWGGIKSIPEAMGDLVESSVSGWTWFFENIGKASKETEGFTECTTSAGDAWTQLSKKLSDSGVNIQSVTENIKKGWSTTVQSIKEKLGTLPGKAQEAWNGIKNAFGSVATWFEEKFRTAWEKVKEVFSEGGQIFSGIKEGLEKSFKTIVNKIIDGMNTIIKKPFNKLNEMITELKKIDVLGIKPFSGFRTISVPQIPKLAQGAVIPASKPFLAMLGDQKSGNNLEAPESLLRQIVREESGNSGGKTTVVAKVGRRDLFEIVIDEAKIRQQATGKNPFDLT